MIDRFDPTDNPYRPTRINQETRTMSESEIQRLRRDTPFGGINPTNMSKLKDQTLVPDFTFLMPNRCIVTPGARRLNY